MLCGKEISVALAKMKMDPSLFGQYGKIVLSEEEMNTLDEWVVYFENKQYPRVSKLVIK